MGVPKFYRWISERYPALSQIVSDSQIPEFDNLYLDMNGIIHNCSHPNDDDVHFRISEDQIYADIFSYIDRLVRMIRPQKVFFMAIDGVAPRAKMNQQRARRFMSARTSEEQMAAALLKGENVSEEKRFDSNCITPGTYFMANLHQKLDEWVKHKVESDPLWQNEGRLRVILSGHDCPGEGEHKIMDFIRFERAQPGYEPNTRHCMYGLDADLIMLGICSHEPHFALLREEVKFNRPTKTSKGKKKDSLKKPDTETKFHLLHLQLFREYLCKEFETLQGHLSFAYNLESIIDDWVLMGFLIGNDFIPHLPHVHIHDDALPLLYDTYKEVLPTLDGYLNENGFLNLNRFQTFLKAFAKNDRKCFMDQLEDAEYMSNKMGRPAACLESIDQKEMPPISLTSFTGFDISSSLSSQDEETSDADDSTSCSAAFVSSDEENCGRERICVVSGGIMGAEAALAELDLEDPVEDESNENLRLMQFKEMSDKEFENDVDKCWSVPMSNAFKRQKKNYYSAKMKIDNISKNELKAQAEGYIRALQWNLHYYYHGCISWNWFFPFHYAPYISDVVDFENMDFAFEKSHPFRPFEQLLAVLPAASAECLPEPLRELMCDPDSPIAEFYPKDFATDLNGKKNDWEAVVLIPFIDQKKLLEAIAAKESLLSAEENARNTHGSHILYTTNMTKAVGQRVVRSFINKDEFRIDISKVVYGLLPGVKQDVFFPGFPTMMHLPHTSQLKEVGVKVFNMASKKKSMLLTIKDRAEFDKPMHSVATDLINKEVLIDWPILSMAKVSEICTETERYVHTEEGVRREKQDPDGRREFLKWAVDIRTRQLSRYAIESSDIVAIALCRRFLGCTYAVEDGVMRRVKQWTGEDITTPVPLQLVVTNVCVDEGKQLGEMEITDAFPPNARVFVMTPEWIGFGHPALVQAVQNPGKSDCRVIVKALMYNSADISQIRSNINKFNLHWFNNFEAGKRSGIDRHLLSRLTGTVFLVDTTREEYNSNPGYHPSKLNIGLGLKLTKLNKEVPDYTRRVAETGYWEFSLLAIQLITEYRNKFRDLISYLEKAHNAEDVYFSSEVWPNKEHRKERMEALKNYLAEVPTASIEKIDGSSKYVDSYVIGQIERVLNQMNSPNEVPKRAKGSVNPAVIYRPSLNNGRVRPDPEADFRLMDRVCHITEGSVVPSGMQGTIVGISGDKIDVLFDRPFKGGYKIRSTLEQGYRVPIGSVVNITFGKERKGRKIAGSSTEVTPDSYVEVKSKKKSKESVPAALKLLTRAQTASTAQNTTKSLRKKNAVFKSEKKSMEHGYTKNVEKELSALLGIGKTEASHAQKDGITPLQETQKEVATTASQIIHLLIGKDSNLEKTVEFPKEDKPTTLDALFTNQSQISSLSENKVEENLTKTNEPERMRANRGRCPPYSHPNSSRRYEKNHEKYQQELQEHPPLRGGMWRGRLGHRGGHPHQPGAFFGNNRFTPNHDQTKPLNVNVTDLKPSTVSRPRKQRGGQNNTLRSPISVNAQNVFDTLLCSRPEESTVDHLNSISISKGHKRNRKPRLAANFFSDGR